MYDFYAFLDRMKYIRRWSLMRSSREENVMEHSWQVAVFAHALAVIDSKIYKNAVDAEKAVLYALYHECSEVMTGDLPTPIKYYNAEIRGAYKEIEDRAKSLSPFVLPDRESREYAIAKAADKLSAYVKCVEELKAGNAEFKKAKESIGRELKEKGLACVDYFTEKFLPAFLLTLDEMDGLD